MNLILQRASKEPDGIFGTLASEDSGFNCVTLEHAYDAGSGDGSYTAKLAAGSYTCLRGLHILEGMTKQFETFQVLGVPIFQGKPVTNILLHVGNFQEDSHGCILLGRRIAPRDLPETGNMITSSKNTFLAFMDLQKDVASFILTVGD